MTGAGVVPSKQVMSVANTVYPCEQNSTDWTVMRSKSVC